MMDIKLGPLSQMWRCLDCGQMFAWHPGFSDHDHPTGCGACDSANIEQLFKDGT